MVDKVQFEVCVVAINNLICDMLLGVDVLEQIRAEINTCEHLLKCTIDNVSYTFKLNTQTHTQNHGDPIKITRPPKQVIQYKECEEGETTLDSRTERDCRRCKKSSAISSVKNIQSRLCMNTESTSLSRRSS